MAHVVRGEFDCFVAVVVLVSFDRGRRAPAQVFRFPILTERTMVTRVGNVCTFSTIYPDAEQVFLIGDFNDWSTPAHAMERWGRETWRASVRLPPGSYRFAYFVVHGRAFREHLGRGS